jgi:hypothetical protein
LDDGTPRKGSGRRDEPAVKLPSKCPACHYLKPAGVHVCPSCGFAPERQSKIESRGGDLVLLKGKARKPSRQELQKFWSGLLRYCEDRGYKRGWAANHYHRKFGMWPRGMHDISSPPDAVCRGWVTSQNIAYRKRMDAEKSRAA